MEVYVFVYHVKPTEGSPEHGKIGSAHAEIYVYEDSRPAAETKALSYIKAIGWDLLDVEDVLVLNDEQILRYRKDVQSQYHRSKKYGLAAFFSASPLKDRDDGLVEIRPLKKPPE